MRNIIRQLTEYNGTHARLAIPHPQAICEHLHLRLKVALIQFVCLLKLTNQPDLTLSLLSFVFSKATLSYLAKLL